MGNCQTFPQYLRHFMLLPGMIEGSNFSTASLILVSFWFYPSNCEVVFLSLSLSLTLKAWGSSFPDQGSDLRHPALETPGLNHWTRGQSLLVVLVCSSLRNDSAQHLFLWLLAPAHFVLKGCTLSSHGFVLINPTGGHSVCSLLFNFAVTDDTVISIAFIS